MDDFIKEYTFLQQTNTVVIKVSVSVVQELTVYLIHKHVKNMFI
jgi:hypothetical protein